MNTCFPLHTCLKIHVSLCVDPSLLSCGQLGFFLEAGPQPTAPGGARGSAHTTTSFFLLPVAQTGLLCCFSAGCGSVTSFRALKPEIRGPLPNQWQVGRRSLGGDPRHISLTGQGTRVWMA